MKRPYIERPLCRVFYSPDQTKPRTDLGSAAARRSHLPGKFRKTGRLPPRRAAAAPGPPERLGAQGVATGDRACVRGGVVAMAAGGGHGWHVAWDWESEGQAGSRGRPRRPAAEATSRCLFSGSNPSERATRKVSALSRALATVCSPLLPVIFPHRVRLVMLVIGRV